MSSPDPLATDLGVIHTPGTQLSVSPRTTCELMIIVDNSLCCLAMIVLSVFSLFDFVHVGILMNNCYTLLFAIQIAVGAPLSHHMEGRSAVQRTPVTQPSSSTRPRSELMLIIGGLFILFFICYRVLSVFSFSFMYMWTF